MTYLEALEPKADLKKENTFISRLAPEFQIKAHIGAYANIINTYRPQLNFDVVEIDHGLAVNELVQPDDVNSENTGPPMFDEVEIIETPQPESAYVWESDHKEENIQVDYNETNIQTKKSDKKKKKKKNKKKNTKIGKFVINPTVEVKSGFIDWLYFLKPIEGGNTYHIIKKKNKKKEKLSKIDEEIQRSVQIGDDIVSENLAILYEKQEHYQLAIEMFKKLILKYPEKSSYFAAKISELNSKIQK